MASQDWDCDRCGEGYPLTSEYPPIKLETPDGEQEWICGGCAKENERQQQRSK